MKEQLITFETAKLAKEKGFDWECRYLYKSEIGWEEGQGVDYNWNSFNSYSAPTQSLLQKWLREIHNIYLVIKPRFKGDLNNPIVDYSYNGEKGDRNNIFYPTYEEALEIGLQEALKLI